MFHHSHQRHGRSALTTRRALAGAIAASLAASSLSPTVVLAQSTSASGIEEVMVTARRRAESAQSVPVSIATLSSEDLEVRSMGNVEQVVQSIPNVFVAGGISNDSTFSMRGIPDVGFFVDGIWQVDTIAQAQRGVIELERVEVLRGPQGTLFGRDTTGGAIRLESKRPADTFGGRVTTTVGTYNRFDVVANIDIPLSETVRTKWTAARETRDGYVKSLTVDRSYGDQDDQTFRGDVVWDPSARLSVRLIGQHSESGFTAPPVTVSIVDPGSPGVDANGGYGWTVPPFQYYELAGAEPVNDINNVNYFPGGKVGDLETRSAFDAGDGVQIKATDWTANVRFDLTDTISITSLSGYSDRFTTNYNDFDGTQYAIFEQNFVYNRDLFSQEFQIAGSTSRLDWVGGLYYWNEEQERRLYRWANYEFTNGTLDFTRVQNSPQCQAPAPGTTPCILVPPNQVGFEGFSTEGYAVFGEVTFKATDRLSLTLGGRYHDQDNGNWGEFPNNPQRPALPSTPGALPPGDPVAAGPRFDETTNSFSKDSYRAAVQYDISNDVMIYAGYSEGFNSGGVGRLTINDENGNPFEVKFPYDPESIRNMEAGIKADWLEGRLRTNVTVFFTEWDDIQLSGQVNNPFRPSEQLATLVTQNVAGAEAKGGEVSILFAPTPSLRLNADVGILRTEYTEVEPGSSVSLGDRFGLAPELQYSLGAQWNGDLAGGSLVTRIDYNWTDEYIRSYVPAFQRTTVDGSGFEEGSRGLLNARIAYSPEGSNWELAVSGTNLTDERYLNGGFFTTLMLFDNGRVGRPREAGISLKVQF